MLTMKGAARQMGSTRSMGFTLIELMITIVVLAIILVIATPSFVRQLDAQAIDGGCQELAKSISLARIEGIRRSRAVSVAPACGSTWTQGWNVFVDVDLAQNQCYRASDGDILITASNVPQRSMTVVPTLPSGVLAIQYTGTGTALQVGGTSGFGAASFTCSIAGSIAQQRVVSVSSFGQSRIQ